MILPMSSPVLRAAAWVRYTTALHLHGDKMDPRPQVLSRTSTQIASAGNRR